MSRESQIVSFLRSRDWKCEIPTDGHPWALKKLIRVFERILHDDKWTSRGRSCFIGIQQSGTRRAVRERIDQTRGRGGKREVLLYLCPAGESFGAVFGNGANLGAFFYGIRMRPISQ